MMHVNNKILSQKIIYDIVINFLQRQVMIVTLCPLTAIIVFFLNNFHKLKKIFYETQMFTCLKSHLWFNDDYVIISVNTHTL